MTDCVFCDEAQAGPNANFALRYPELDSRILWSDGKLFAMPCIGQLRPGHFMVIPHRHYATFRDAAEALGSLDVHISSGIDHVRRALGLEAKTMLVFEHGARAPEDGGCGIYHAHLHIVPVEKSFDVSAVFGLEMPHAANCLNTIFTEPGDPGSYALAGIWGETFRCQRLSAPLPSQYMRRRLAAALGEERWDWREAWREPALLTAIAAVQQSNPLFS